ncbi:MAG: DUF1996 domain-containing protein [Actinobacteria bacterium]|nr:MAG: DUF1996 domain-containing protein [Actinomycetota bacterium]
MAIPSIALRTFDRYADNKGGIGRPAGLAGSRTEGGRTVRRSWLVIILGLTVITGGVTTAQAEGVFTTDCFASHRAPDDPIVYPGQPGASHSHDFFGNTTTDASSTYASMIAGGTNCEEPGDTAGYWAPTLLARDGTPIAPRRIKVYYRDTPNPSGHVTPFPPDFRMIAGGMASAGVLSGWNCDATALAPTALIDCSGGTPGTTYVRGSIIFPMCGQLNAAGNVVKDSGDHRSHVAYGARKACPADHPVQLPAIKVNIRYGVSNCIAAGCHLSSDMPGDVPGSTLHADFWNTWDQATLEQLVNTQLNA